MSAIAGIDQALWDIKGKVLGVPVYELLGGLVRDSMKVYSWVGGDRPADIIADMQRADGRRLRHLQDQRHRGDGACSTRRARSTPRWPRSPRSARPSAHQVELRPRLPRPRRARRWPRCCCASWSRTGRCSSKSRCWPSRPSTTRAWPQAPRSRWRPANACTRASSSSACSQAGGLAIVQPDLSHAGGITECLKIAVHGRSLRRRARAALPARPGGAGGLPAGRLRVVQRRAAGAEHGHPLQPGRRAARLRDQQGRLPHRRTATSTPLPKPGLGVEVDEERVIDASRNAPDWHNPLWRHADGSVAEW